MNKLFKKTNEIKVMRDPIHGYIHVEYQVLWDCINAPEFQRLRRIRQLGASFMVYHTAEHSRFSHSLGVYEIVRRLVSENDDINKAISDNDKIVVMLAGLLHDIGHGPYSHAFEAICPIHHEEFSKMVLLEKTNINKILESYKKGLSKEVASVIDHTHKNIVLSQLVSSQLDADRMDYLLRDAYFTGTKYGEFDLERMLRTIRVKDKKMVVKESAIHTVEDYIMARYHMYWQVYYHPTARSYELMLSSLFSRLKDLYKVNPDEFKDLDVFIPFLKQKHKITVEDHYRMDEYACMYCFEKLTQSDDPVVSDLSSRLVNRKLFDYEDIDSNINKKKKDLIKKGYDPKYYLLMDKLAQRPYMPYKNDSKSVIWVIMDDGKIKELSKASVIVNALVHGQNKNDNKMFYPKDK